MITYWQQENGKLVSKEKEELVPEMNTWVDARSVTRDDIRELEETYGIDSENMIFLTRTNFPELNGMMTLDILLQL